MSDSFSLLSSTHVAAPRPVRCRPLPSRRRGGCCTPVIANHAFGAFPALDPLNTARETRPFARFPRGKRGVYSVSRAGPTKYSAGFGGPGTQLPGNPPRFPRGKRGETRVRGAGKARSPRGIRLIILSNHRQRLPTGNPVRGTRFYRVSRAGRGSLCPTTGDTTAKVTFG